MVVRLPVLPFRRLNRDENVDFQRRRECRGEEAGTLDGGLERRGVDDPHVPTLAGRRGNGFRGKSEETMKNLARVGFLATFLVAAAPPGVVASEAPCGTLEGLHARPDCESFAEGTGAAPARCRPPRGEPPASRRSRAPVGSSVEGRAHELSLIHISEPTRPY